MSSRTRLILLSCFMTLMYVITSLPSANEGLALTVRERALFDRVVRLQAALWDGLAERGVKLSPENDPQKTGLIGEEWSDMTTTLGPYDVKRTSTHPLWAVWLFRYFSGVSSRQPLRIAVNSSGSFPGLLLSALAAAEECGAETVLMCSLTASTWGANRLDAPVSIMLDILCANGLTSAKPALYTLGGGSEIGKALDETVKTALALSVEGSGVPLARAGSLNEVVAIKQNIIDSHNANLLVTVGGPASARELERTRRPVLRLLNLKELSAEAGIPFGPVSEFKPMFVLSPRPVRKGRFIPLALTALIVFFTFLCLHKRWHWREI